MIRLLPFLILALIIYLALRYARLLPVAERKRFWLKASLFALAGTIVLLALTGRLHWLAAVIGAGLPLIAPASKWIRYLWALKPSPGASQPPTAHTMTVSEALEILGLEVNCNREEIIQAHRRLMQKVHPDRSGSDYLAAKVNQAKDLLLSQLS